MGKYADRINRHSELKQCGLNREVLATSIRKIAMAHSALPLCDCSLIARMAQKCLMHFGIKPAFCAGHVIWRLSDHYGSVAGHHPALGGMLKKRDDQQDGIEGHCWLELGNEIIDFTAWQVPYKIREMDLREGRETPITWKPDYLWLNKRYLQNVHALIYHGQVGAYYERVPRIEELWHGRSTKIDEAVIAIQNLYRAILENPTVAAIPIEGRASGFYQKLSAN